MYTSDNGYDEKELENDTNTSSSSSKGTIILCVFLAIVLAVLVFFAFIKKDDDEDLDEDNDTYVVTIDPSTVSVNVGGSVILTATVKNSNNESVSNPQITWVINDTSIATVDKGIVKGVKLGKTKVTATYTSDGGQKYSADKDVSVIEGDLGVALTNVEVSPQSLSMSINDTKQLTLTMTPPNGNITSKVFTSSNTSVAMVDSNGAVTAVGSGSATIEVNINNGAFVKTINVTVSDGSYSPSITFLPYPTPSPSGTVPQSIKITNKVDKIKVGESVTLNYEVLPSTATDKTGSWVSFSPSIASVDSSGTVTGVSVGKVTITVAANGMAGVSDSVTIEVVSDNDIKVTDINLSTTNVTLTAGSSETILATVVPANATNTDLNFVPSDGSIAQVTPNADKTSAIITGIAAGTTTITVSSNDGVSKTIFVTVTAATTPSNNGNGCGSNNNLNCPSGQYAYCGKCYGCPAGNYCSGNKKNACPAGKGSVKNSSSYTDCISCAKGFYSTGDGKGCIACPNNTTTASSGSTSKNDCVSNTELTRNCGIGNYNSNGNCKMCDYGNYCDNGISKSPCAAGTGTRSGATSQAQCGTCTGNFYSTGDGTGCVKTCPANQSVNATHTGCDGGSATQTPTTHSYCCVRWDGNDYKWVTSYELGKCDSGYFRDPGLSAGNCKKTVSTPTPTSNSVVCCVNGSYRTGISASYCNTLGGKVASDKSECILSIPTPTPTSTSSKCPPGQYKLSGICTNCPIGSYCPGDNTKRACTGGKTTNGTGKTSFSDCI